MEAMGTEQNNLGLLEALSDKLWGENANSRMEMSATPAQDVWDLSRKNRDGFDLISDRLRFGPIWYAGPDAVHYALVVANTVSLALSPGDHPRVL